VEHVYCFRLGTGNCYKVGRTKNSPEERKRGLSTGSPEKFEPYRDIETENAPELEAYIHHLLDEKRAANGEFFNVSSQELDEAVDQALAFLAESQPLCREADELKQRKPLNDTPVEATPEMLEAYRQLRRLRQENYLMEKQICLLESKIQVAIGDAVGMQGIASWKWVSRPTLDIARFKAEQESLYQAYLRESGVGGSASRKWILLGED
jgi:Meiotically up-regulated gene 113